MCYHDEDFNIFIRKIEKNHTEINKVFNEFELVDGIWEKEKLICEIRKQLKDDPLNQDLIDKLHRLISENNQNIDENLSFIEVP